MTQRSRFPALPVTSKCGPSEKMQAVSTNFSVQRFEIGHSVLQIRLSASWVLFVMWHHALPGTLLFPVAVCYSLVSRLFGSITPNRWGSRCPGRSIRTISGEGFLRRSSRPTTIDCWALIVSNLSTSVTCFIKRPIFELAVIRFGIAHLSRLRPAECRGEFRFSKESSGYSLMDIEPDGTIRLAGYRRQNKYLWEREV